MEEALELVRAKDAKERMAGVERLHQVLESSRKGLSSAEVTALVDLSMDLLKDANFRVSQGALQTLSAAAVLAGEEFKLHFNGLVPAVVERLGDGKQPVRDAARQLLVTLMEVSSPTIVVERAGSYAWAHKSWRVREEFARVVATAIGLFASTELPLKRALLPHVLQLLNDLNYSVREAAILCVEEMYTQGGMQFRDELQSQNLPSSMMKEINARLAKIEPRAHSTDEHGSHLIPSEIKSFNVGQKRSSANGKNNPRGTLLSVGESDVTEKPVDPVKVYSEKELVREFEKIASTLVPEKDWSDRIAAMQRVEGLVFGGAVDYPSFPMVLKQLVIPLSSQLSDRRSSIVKQACHLLCLLSKELLGDFEACAEMFIPVLFKLVVITVLVIAESANNCIKTMLCNCKVARVLPRIADSAKNDRSAVLRARCCEYALLVLEYWADAPEIQRSADLYEDLIKCCAADAMSEVRSMARTCYRMFMKTWPDRSRRLFLSFDPAIQRIINEENGAMHKRFPSPLHERGGQLSHASSHVPHANSPGYGTTAIVAMDKTASIASGTSLSSSGQLVSQTKPTAKGAERSLESMLHASKQQVSAIETLLKGLNSSQKQISSAAQSDSLDQGLDPPSARNPPFPPAVTATSPLSIQSSAVSDLTINNIVRGTIRNNGSITDHSFPHGQPSKDLSKLYDGHLSSDSLSASSLPYASRRRERLQEGGAIDDSNNIRSTRRFPSIQIDRQHSETHKDAGFRDSQNNYVPNFQRPLLRKQVLGRTSATGRSSFDDSQLSFGEMASYFDGPASLSDALSEGLSPSSDWVARVSAFNHLQTLLQQGPQGIYEVIQSFEKVMKLFFQHLDDPHHKVAQAALSTLAEIIPACRKPFESYIERILPHVFPRLIDQKESVRQPCSATLDIAGRNYNIDSLLPALLRSLDEQRSPKAKLAVIEFANKSFNKHRVHSNAYSNCGFLKLWLAKLAPIVNDKNSKLKEAAISGIIAVYTYFDSTSVLNFIISLSVEEQNCLRRALRQYTPRIEVDLINFLQNKKERQRAKSFSDHSDIIGISSDEGYGVTLKKSHFFGRYSAGSVDDEGGRKWNFMQETTQVSSSMGPANSVETQRQFYQNVTPSSDMEVAKSKDQNNITEGMVSRTNRVEMADHSVCGSPLATPHLDINRIMDSDGRKAHGWSSINSNIRDMELTFDKSTSVKSNHNADNGHSIPQLLHQISIRNDENTSSNKCAALQQLVEVSVVNNHSVWTKYFNQILTAVLGVLDDPDSSAKELALSLIIEMLNHQKAAMEESVEIVTEKLIHATKDVVQKVSNDAHNCLTTILAHYDTFRCLAVVVPLLVNDDEKTLIVGINCLTKLVGRLSQEQLMTQLRSFLPALFDAFGNQNPDVRKAVVFCLVDIYIMLGKAFLPYLEGLNGKQLRLVTIYASRISQGRSVGVVQ